MNSIQWWGVEGPWNKPRLNKWVVFNQAGLFARQSRSGDGSETTAGAYQRQDVSAAHLDPAVIVTLAKIAIT